MKKLLVVLLIILSIMSLLPASVFTSNASSFDDVLESFPQSYRADLKKLHDQYPNWIFEPVYTKLKWDSVVAAQGGSNGVVLNGSAYSDMLKSKKSSDYNYSTGKYYDQTSYTTVPGNDFAISYFLDPRNFLNVQGIFQFEKLSFDPSVSQDDVENALKGTFMYKTGASYLDASGNKVKVKTLYSKLIYNAGKKYNINPTFIAEKIINEIGSHGSVPTFGTNPYYPGIYNYYNIGAYGTNAPVNGLKWASGSGSYGRPWTSPRKSIFGGAEFLASLYIDVGQDTNYFQKFNVQPGAKYSPNTHQYMSNLCATALIAYSTYNAYNRDNKLQDKRTFLIPVYSDMPAVNDNGGKISLLDSQNQYGTALRDCKLRKEASEYSTQIGTVPSGKTVKIVSVLVNSTHSPDSFIKYPVWSKISYSDNGKKYSGYIYFNMLKLETNTIVSVGNYTPVVTKTNKELSLKYISLDETIAKVSGSKIKFLKAGTVDVYAYDSVGHFDRIRYTVRSDIKGKTITGIKVSNVKTSSAVISFNKNSSFDSYRVNVIDSDGKLVLSKSTKNNSVTVSKLSENSKYKVLVTGVKKYTYSAKSKYVSFSTDYFPPAKVQGLSAALSDDLLSVVLKWKKSSHADGYTVYKYDESKKKYVDIGSTTAQTFSIEDSTVLKETKFKVKSYRFAGGKKVYCESAAAVTYKPGSFTPEKVNAFSAKSKSATTILLTWTKVKNATGYRIYQYNEKTGKYKKIKLAVEDSYTVNDLKALTKYKFKIVPVTTLYGKTFAGKGTVIAAYTLPDTPGSIKTSSDTDGKTKISWSEVNGADGYKIYKYDKTKGKFAYIEKIENNSYSVKVKAGETVKFKIRAYAVIGNKVYNSKASKAITITK